jgi:glycosyltransferase involved in cell wall biosynthesis
VIHSNGFKMHVLGSWVRPANAALIWHIHDYVSGRPLMSRLLVRCRTRCNAAIANSNSVAIDLKRILPNLPVVPIYNAIDMARFTPNGEMLDLDRLSGLAPAAPGTIRVGLLATFARWKGHEVFFRALAQLPQDLSVRGYVIGGPIYRTGGSQHSREGLQQMAKKLGLEGTVGFAGFQDDSAAALRSLDIVVHASTQPEPFGMVIIEGMACGKALIASQAGGASELFTDGVNALSHPPGDDAELARQIERLARNEELRRGLGAAGRTSVQRLFHGKRLAGQLVSLYQHASAQAGATLNAHGAGQPELVAPASLPTPGE